MNFKFVSRISLRKTCVALLRVYFIVTKKYFNSNYKTYYHQKKVRSLFTKIKLWRINFHFISHVHFFDILFKKMYFLQCFTAL